MEVALAVSPRGVKKTINPLKHRLVAGALGREVIRGSRSKMKLVLINMGTSLGVGSAARRINTLRPGQKKCGAKNKGSARAEK